MTLLGFDYGSKRIGVAVGETLTQSARGLATLKTLRAQPDWEGIGRLIDEWQPQGLVVGLPLNDDGSEHPTTRAARRFGNRLQGRYRLPVHWIDERLSSHAAENWQDRRPRQRADIDKEAARVILETWLAEPAAGSTSASSFLQQGSES